MDLPQLLIINYQDLVKKIIYQFASNRHKKMVSTSLFNIHQGPFECLREYLTFFNEVITAVIHSNQEMFVEVYQNRIKAGHFNKSLAQEATNVLGGSNDTCIMLH